MPWLPIKRWMWRELLTVQGKPVTVNYRRPDTMLNEQGVVVRYHVPHPTTPALERFAAMTDRILIDDDYCVVWRGGRTFRVDDETTTTPARFYYQAMTGEKLRDGEPLKRACLTAGCVKHWER